MSMTKYAILIYDDQAGYETMSPEAWAAVIDAHSAFVKGVFELGGSLAGGEALAATRTATSIRGGSTVTDGPFVETKEALGGFYVVEARDLDHALEMAKLCPAPFGGVEVRPIVDPTQANPF
ncbi:YciI family protein [Nocardioides sp. S-58]|uniref:YciI family protein n=1 Tax=Nocardioides renjunii TaxID=3095075 RepID=A0ABU5KBF0_9ACTN|nr:YciI family protein [Nocardioides sp. S-58]MDZ5662283.1 YciI family protein [Nocardioides sp. S-58]